jgi:hypothetical protein
MKWRPPDGWTTEWRAWFEAPACGNGREKRRLRSVQEAVRHAVTELPATERRVIERHFFDGGSLAHIADETGLSLVRIQVLRRRALGRLRERLTLFVQTTYGLGATVRPDCPVCRAPWRQTAEELLDEKTPDMTWGMLARRLERAVGWTPSTVQILIGHQRNHRAFSHEATVADEQMETEIEEVA